MTTIFTAMHKNAATIATGMGFMLKCTVFWNHRAETVRFSNILLNIYISFLDWQL